MHASNNDPGLWLATFKVELSSASANLYGNTRQQAELRLTAEVQPGQPPLTTDQLSSLLLVVELADGTYEQLPYSGTGTLGWWQSLERDTRYDLMPGAGNATSSSTGNTSVASKLLYVSTHHAGGSNVKLRAQIKKDANTTYYTDAAAGFETYVTLTTVHPPTFSESDYQWLKAIDEGDINNMFLHEYALRLKMLGFSSPSVLDVTGMIRWHRNESSETYATYVGMALPGVEKTVHYNEAIRTGPDFKPNSTAKSPDSDALILVLQGADNIPFNREGLDHGGPCKVRLVDRHGNDHYVLFRFSSEGSDLDRRTNIVVSYSVVE
ncbi:hypothetical protein P0Y43_10015 [Pseudomonas entomophila]|uniref:hypothetical protein n=1 Tax=Pseudomonas entomophila TaxID=312306 RepID=UPI0023D8764E|nr:hypothetical protein [Pseudomonas entomophila]MDF0731058.1 hypothetical protein [Pseudomonas entomophila]